MVKKISTLHKEAVVRSYLERKQQSSSTSYASVAAEFGVSEASLNRWLQQYRAAGEVAEPKPKRNGFAPMFGEAELDSLERWIRQNPTARLWEAVAFASAELGLTASETTIRKALQRRGISKQRLRVDANAASDAGNTKQAFRYTDRHRRKPEDKPERRAYPSDFTDAEWAEVESIWSTNAKAVPEAHRLRDVLDAIRYISATGCPWRYLPHDFPPHTTVRRWFDVWNRDGTLERVNDALRRLLRRRCDREETPSVIIIDSQSVRTREGGEERGYDGGKKIAGRKRHIAVDTEGFVWSMAIHGASIQDRDGIDAVIEDDVREKLPRLEKILADAGYQGKAEARTLARVGVPIEIVRRRGDTTNGEWATKDAPPAPRAKGFKVLPKRWIVERTFAWCNRRRRLAVDFERSATSAKSWVKHAFQHIMVARMVS